MEIYFSSYKLTPLRKANALTTMRAKEGVLLWAKKDSLEVADYFPHQELGDESVEEFLATFPNLKNPYHESVYAQLLQPKTPIPDGRFFNHQLWVNGSTVEAPVVKVKISPAETELAPTLLHSSCRLRLDANGQFTQSEIFKFFSQFSVNVLERIDYIEDPSASGNWNDIPVRTARDFIEGEPYDVLIYKPNRKKSPETSKKIIFSSYMGSSYGMLHVYRELMKTGDLNEYHGLLTPGLYQEEKKLFKGSYQEGFRPDFEVIKKLQSDLALLNWRQLCTL